jgi:hypothetical protein
LVEVNEVMIEDLRVWIDEYVVEIAVCLCDWETVNWNREESWFGGEGRGICIQKLTIGISVNR